MEIYGTIRNTANVWHTMNDSEHEPKNILSVTAVNGSSPNGYVEIGFATCDKVGTFLVVPDETCARVGIMAGASVGMSTASIYFSQNGTSIPPNSISNSNANFWIYGIMKMAEEVNSQECPTCHGSGRIPL